MPKYKLIEPVVFRYLSGGLLTEAIGLDVVKGSELPLMLNSYSKLL